MCALCLLLAVITTADPPLRIRVTWETHVLDAAKQHVGARDRRERELNLAGVDAAEVAASGLGR